jgi:hypothetical protein
MARHYMKGGNQCQSGSAIDGGRRSRRGRKRTLRGGAYGAGDPVSAGLGVGNMPWGYVNTAVGAGDYTKDASGAVPTNEGAGYAAAGGRRRRGSRRTRRKSVAQIKRLLKAKGMKVSGSRRALTARARKARIPLKGGGPVTGTAYGAYGGEGFAGMANQERGAHPSSNGVVPLA